MPQALLILTLTRCGQFKVGDPKDLCWFALQCSSAFDGPLLPSDGDVDTALAAIMPWSLLGASGSAAPPGPSKQVLLRGVLVNADGTTSTTTLAASAELPTSSSANPFAQSIRANAQSHLVALAKNQPSSVEWKLGSNSGPNEDEGGSLGKYLQYLSSLPGELARQAGTVLFFAVPASSLFTFDSAGNPMPNAVRLWVAPEQLELAGTQALDSVLVQPVDLPYLEGSYSSTAGKSVVVRGPGTELAPLLKPIEHPVFSLNSYGVDVREASSDLLRLETQVLDALDPATQSRVLTAEVVRNQLRISHSSIPAPVPEELCTAIRAADQVQSFSSRCQTHPFSQACAEVGECLALQIDDTNATALREAIAKVAQPPLVGALSDLVTVQTLCELLQVKGAAPKDLLLSLGTECTELALCRLLATELGRVLKAGTGLPQPLANAALAAWSAMATDKDQSRQLALAQVGWRNWRERHEAQPLLDTLSDTSSTTHASPKIALRNNVRTTLVARWTPTYLKSITGFLRLGWLSPRESMELAGDPDESAQRIADAILSASWSDQSQARKSLAASGSGFAFALGAAKNELIHVSPKDLQEGQWSDQFTAVSGFGVLIRRASPGQSLANRPWRLVTSGIARLSSGETLNVPLAIPQRAVFDRNVWRAETEYAGTHLLTESLLSEAYAETGHDSGTSPAGTGTLINYTPALTEAQLSPPPLRYGDQYEVAAFVMDQGAGLPTALAKAGEPWALDPAALDRPLSTGAQAWQTRYLRKTPVGDLTVVADTTDRHWPPLPKKVSLRSKEWWQASGNANAQAPAVLLREPSDATISNSVSTTAGFSLFPPSIDEHVLLRWAAPPVGAMTPGLKQSLVKAYTDLLLARAAGKKIQSAAKELLPHDPAVVALGIRVRYVDAVSQMQAEQTQRLKLTSVSGQPFVMQSVSVRLAAHPMRKLEVDAGASTVLVQVPAGEFVCLEIYPLVPDADMAARFDRDAVAGQLAEDVSFAGFAAFQPAVVLAETATSQMPTAADLYANFRVDYVADGAQPVECAFGGAVAGLPMVNDFSIERQKWVWRNLPLAESADFGGLKDAQLLRRLSGGLPDEAFTHPDGDPKVQTWERIALVDNGLSIRPPIDDTWPRSQPKGKDAGGPSSKSVLFRDSLDGTSQGLYLRYSLTAHSRYAPVIAGPLASVRMKLKGGEDWRRRVAPFRGTNVRPLKILSVVPLTESIEAPPPGFGSGARPFMVLLDETWFREYGVNERLDVVLALENPEILEGDRPAEELDLRPFRAGPLPDHHLPKPPLDASKPYAADRYFLKTLTNEAGAASAPKQLQVFGPFGFTMDTTPDEALANATAFIVTPPTDWKVLPHWAMFVKLRRVLDYPGTAAPLHSDWSDAKAVYTLPDARALCSGSGHASYVSASKKVALDGLTWVLDPVLEASGPASPARADYRYFLMVSRKVADAGSESLQKEVPMGIFRLTPPTTAAAISGKTEVDAKWLGIDTPPKGELVGRLLEVWAEARLDGKPSRLDDANSPADFWDGLLAPIKGFGVPGQDDHPQGDAAGMIRRISHAFRVRSD